MKKLFCLIASLCLLLSGAATIATKNYASAAVENVADNASLIVTASGNEGENGTAAVYGEGEKLSFDMLKTVSGGVMGFISTDKRNVSGEAEGIFYEYSFESGYNYELTFSDGKITISRRDFFADKYETVDTKTVSNGGYLGLYARSDGKKSASFIIDDFVCADKNGVAKIIDRFDIRQPDKRGAISKYSNLGGYIDAYDDIMYTVAFITESGDLIARQKVSEYNHVTFPETPRIDGYRFKEWKGDIKNVVKDGTCVAVYEEGEEPQPSESDSGNTSTNPSSDNNSGKDPDGNSGKRGCGSAVGFTGGLAAIAASAILFIGRKRDDE